MTYPSEVTAEVRARNRVMRYTRSGSGPLLLLVGDSADRWTGFRERLAQRFKVVVPTVPASTTDVAEWLDSLLEGLGAGEATILAAGRHCDGALALALDDSDRVRRVVLIPDVEQADVLGARYLTDAG